MKSIKNLIPIFIFLISFFDEFDLPACTTISLSNNKMAILAGNEDHPVLTDSYLVVDSRGSFGVIYFAAPWDEWPLLMMSGINEKGLSFHTNWIPRQRLNPHASKKTILKRPIPNSLEESFCFIELPGRKVMSEFSSVGEVIAALHTFTLGDSMNVQIHIADKSGASAVIHPGLDGGITYTRKSRKKGFLVSTNFNLAKLNKEHWFCGRYITANKMLAKVNAKKNASMSSLVSVLDATHLNSVQVQTIYSFIYDLKNLHIKVYNDRQFDTSYLIKVKEELTKTGTYRKIAMQELYSKERK